MTLLPHKNENWVESIYHFWKLMMTEEEKKWLIDQVDKETQEKWEKQQPRDEPDDPPWWLPKIFGGENEAIEKVLERRAEYYDFWMDEVQDYFYIVEYDMEKWLQPVISRRKFLLKKRGEATDEFTDSYWLARLDEIINIFTMLKMDKYASMEER